MLNVAVLVSGGGTNLQAILDRVVEGELPNDRETLLAYARNFTAPDIPGD